MTTPPNPPPGGQQPHPGQPPVYGTGYGGVQYPYPPGQQPPQQGGPGRYGETHVGGNPYAAAPYGADPYAYGGGPSPAGLDPRDAAPRPRPGIMVLSLVLLLVSAFPYLFVGVAALLVPLSEETFPPELLDNPQVAEAGLTPEVLVSLVRGVGVFLLVLALLFMLFAVLAFVGQNWARILVTVMTAGFTLFALYIALSGGAADPIGLAVLVGPTLLALIGAGLMFAPDPRAWFAAPSRR